MPGRGGTPVHRPATSKACRPQGLMPRDPREGCGSITYSGEKFKEAALEMCTAKLYTALLAADVALREGHGQGIPPGHKNQPREDKTTVKMSQGKKTLSRATPVCRIPSSLLSGNISALPAPLPLFPAGRAWWLSLGPCAGTLPGAASQGAALRACTGDTQWDTQTPAETRSLIHISQTIFFPIFPPHTLLLGH